MGDNCSLLLYHAYTDTNWGWTYVNFANFFISTLGAHSLSQRTGHTRNLIQTLQTLDEMRANKIAPAAARDPAMLEILVSFPCSYVLTQIRSLNCYHLLILGWLGASNWMGYWRCWFIGSFRGGQGILSYPTDCDKAAMNTRNTITFRFLDLFFSLTDRNQICYLLELKAQFFQCWCWSVEQIHFSICHSNRC